MEKECTECKYYKYLEVSGSPWTYRWKCTRTNITNMHANTMKLDTLWCFEARRVPFWRTPVSIIIGIWISVFLFGVIYFLGVGFHLANIGDFSPVPIVIPIIVGMISITVGIFGGIQWYKRRL